MAARGTPVESIAERLLGAEPAEVPHRLCALAVELLPVDGASVSLRSNGMPVLVGASDEQSARLAEMQATLGDGPCVRAAETATVVYACDLMESQDARRWPVFAHEASAAGIRSVCSLPLGNRSVCVGTLDLYGTLPGALTTTELSVARLLVGEMTVALTSLPRDGSSWLGGLTGDHDEVHQAVGMIMAQLAVPSDEALDRLRAYAFGRGRTVLDVAHDVLARRTRFDR